MHSRPLTAARGLVDRCIRIKPSAICIGAQKSGTTTLYHYLGHHPEISMPATKELDFFNCDRNFAKGLSFYYSLFPRKSWGFSRQISLDVTPGYLGGAERAASRIHDFDPDVRLIALLRNPITRAYSAWQMYRNYCKRDNDWFFKWVSACECAESVQNYRRRSSKFGDSFEHDIVEELESIQGNQKIEMGILTLGNYYRLLSLFYDHFAPEQLMIIQSEDFKDSTHRVLARLEEFLSLQSIDWGAFALKPQLVGEYDRQSITSAEKSILEEFYSPRNEKLFGLIGRRMSW